MAYGEEAVPPPPADIGFGFYYDAGQMDVSREPEWFSRMAEHGCNTVTVYFRNADQLARQLDLAVEKGLAEYPVFLLPNIDDWATALNEAKKQGRHTDKWPPLLLYGPDELALDDPARFGTIDGTRKGLQETRRRVLESSSGVRFGATAYGDAAFTYADVLDVTVVISYWCTQPLKTYIEAVGGQFWAYDAGIVHKQKNARMARFMTGWWAWKVRPKVFLAWSFMDAVTDEKQPQGEGCEYPVLDGWSEGTLDYRVLRELEAAIADHPGADAARATLWLQEVADRVPWNPYSGQIGRPPEYVDPYVQFFYDDPPLRDLEALRQHADYWVHKITGRPMRW